MLEQHGECTTRTILIPWIDEWMDTVPVRTAKGHHYFDIYEDENCEWEDEHHCCVSEHSEIEKR